MSCARASFDPEQELHTLEALAKQHAPSSREHLAILLAAKALLFIHATRQGGAFADYAEGIDTDLTEGQREQIERLGAG